MGNRLRRSVPRIGSAIGGFAKTVHHCPVSISTEGGYSGKSDVDSIPCRDVRTRYSVPRRQIRDIPRNFWMQRTDMHCGAGYRRPEHGELLGRASQEPTVFGAKTSLLA